MLFIAGSHQTQRAVVRRMSMQSVHARVRALRGSRHVDRPCVRRVDGRRREPFAMIVGFARSNAVMIVHVRVRRWIVRELSIERFVAHVH